MVDIEVKVCGGCKQEFPKTLEHFYKQTGSKDGLSWDCKTCRRAAKKKKYWQNHEAEKARLRANYYKHHDAYRQYNREYAVANRDYELERRRRHYHENKQHYINNAEAWRQENIQHYKQLAAAGAALRVARENALPNHFTDRDWERCLDYWQGRCAYCGNPPGLLKNTFIQTDHVIAVADERPDNPGTVPGNILPVCFDCNMSKRDKPVESWLIWRFGKRKGQEAMKRIHAYFAWLTEGVVTR
jgi:hypothetical protein